MTKAKAKEDAAEEKEPLVVSEIRMSLLEVVQEGDDKGKHTKHISVEITDPVLCAAIQALIEPELLDADGETTTLDDLADAHKVEIKPKKSKAKKDDEEAA